MPILERIAPTQAHTTAVSDYAAHRLDVIYGSDGLSPSSIQSWQSLPSLYECKRFLAQGPLEVLLNLSGRILRR